MPANQSTLTQIAKNNSAFMKAIKHADGAGVATVYTESAQILPPNFEIMSGKPAIQAFWQGAMDMGVAEAELETIEFEEHGDTAWEVGKGTLKTKVGHVIDVAKYIVIWKREHGVWKWHRDIWNSSQPAG